MFAELEPYRELYDAILSYDGSGLYEDVVRPWVRAQDGERQWRDSFARRRGEPIPAATVEELCRLYALSRIVDLLQLGLAPAGSVDMNGWRTVPVQREERAEFMESLGMQPIARTSFHPFFHEIVTVRQLTQAEQLELLRHRCFVQCAKPHEERWPYGYSHREQE